MILSRLLVVMLVLLTACTEETVSTPPPTTIDELISQLKAQPSRTKVKLLFVISAKEGEIHKLNHLSSTHLFTFKKKDLRHVIAFTDRPARHAHDLSLPMFSSIWEHGNNSFVDDPPNAVLTDDTGKVGITVLTDFIDNPDTITFRLNRDAYKTIDSDDSLATTLVNPVLVIDSVITAGGVALLLQQGAKACAAVECWWALAG